MQNLGALCSWLKPSSTVNFIGLLAPHRKHSEQNNWIPDAHSFSFLLRGTMNSLSTHRGENLHPIFINISWRTMTAWRDKHCLKQNGAKYRKRIIQHENRRFLNAVRNECAWHAKNNLDIIAYYSVDDWIELANIIFLFRH